MANSRRRVHAAAGAVSLPQAQRNRRRNGWTWLWALAGILLIVLGGAAVLYSQPASEPAPAVPVVQPFAETAPDTYLGSAAAPVMGPSMLAVPDVGIQIPVLEEPAVNGYLVIPDTPDSNRVAHYDATVPVGSVKGSTILAGHVNQKDGSLAPMANLGKVAKGTPVYVTDSAGAIHRYKVQTLTTLRKDEAPDAWFSTTGAAQLVLLTCDRNSSYSPIAGVDQYNNYTAVTAIPWP